MSTDTDSATASTVGEDAARGLESRLRGRLIRPSDADYDEARAVWNGMVDKRPGLIARCAGVGDVLAAVNFAREHGLLVAVRGGGHNVSGNAVCDEGLVIDLSNWERPEDDEACVGWGRTAFRALDLFSTGAEYVNLPGTYEDHDRMIRDTFGSNLDPSRRPEATVRPGQPLPAQPQHPPELTVTPRARGYGLTGPRGSFGSGRETRRPPRRRRTVLPRHPRSPAAESPRSAPASRPLGRPVRCPHRG